MAVIETKRRLEEMENEKLKTDLDELKNKLKEKEEQIAYFSQLVIEAPPVILLTKAIDTT